MDDYIAYVEEHPDHVLIQTDSVEGKATDKLRLLTVMFVKTGFQLETSRWIKRNRLKR